MAACFGYFFRILAQRGFVKVEISRDLALILTFRETFGSADV